MSIGPSTISLVQSDNPTYTTEPIGMSSVTVVRLITDRGVSLAELFAASTAAADDVFDSGVRVRFFGG